MCFVSGFVVHLNICQWLGEKFLVKHAADKFYPKFFIWARKEFLYPITDFISE